MQIYPRFDDKQNYIFKELFLLALELCNTGDSNIEWLKCCVYIYRRSDSSDHSNFDVITIFLPFLHLVFISNHTRKLINGRRFLLLSYLVVRPFFLNRISSLFSSQLRSLFAFKIRLCRALSMCTLKISFGFPIKSIDFSLQIISHPTGIASHVSSFLHAIGQQTIIRYKSIQFCWKHFEILDSTGRTYLNLLVHWIPWF